MAGVKFSVCLFPGASSNQRSASTTHDVSSHVKGFLRSHIAKYMLTVETISAKCVGSFPSSHCEN